MTMPPIDNHRTGVMARIVPSDSKELVFILDRHPVPGTENMLYWYGPPGIMQYLYNTDDKTLFGFNIACPSCGQIRSIMTCERDEARNRWNMKGNPGDISTVTLDPPIKKTCCGWQGSLIEGVFVCME